MIKSIWGKNFLSWEHLEFNFDLGVITKLTGFNFDDNTSEGCGKSSIPNLVTMICYGSIPKDDVKIDEIIRENQKSFEGEISFSDGVKIFRSRKPNDLYLVKPGSEPERGSTAIETQKMINNYLKRSFNTFCQTSYFPQDFKYKFVSAKEDEKAKIISEIQGLEIFDIARKETKLLIKKEKSNLETLKERLIGSNNLLNSLSEQLQHNECLQTEFKHDVESEIKSVSAKLDEEIETLKVRKEEQKNAALKSSKLVMAEKEYVELEKKLVKIDMSLQTAQESQEKIMALKLRRAELKHKLTTLSSDKKKTADKLEILKKELIGLKKDLEDVQDFKKQAQNLQEVLDNFNIEHLKEKKYKTDLEIRVLNRELEEIEKKTKKISTIGKGVCDKCYQEISGEVLENKIDALGQEYEQKNETLNSKVEDLKGLVMELNKAIEIDAVFKEVAEEIKSEKNIINSIKSKKDLGEELIGVIMSLDKHFVDLNLEVDVIAQSIEDQSEINMESFLQEKAILKEQLSDLAVKLRIYKTALGLYNELETMIFVSEAEIKNFKLRLKELKSKKPKDLIKLAKNLKEKIKESKVQVKDLEDMKAKSLSHLAQLEQLKDSFKEVKSYIFQSVLKELTYRCNRYLQKLYDIPIYLEFSNVSDGEISKIKTKLEIDGVSRPLGLFSGGQGVRINLAVNLALGDLAQERTNSPLNGVRIFDEQLIHLSLESKEKVLKLFEELKETVLFVEHDKFIDNIVDNVFDIEYRNGVSRRANSTMEV